MSSHPSSDPTCSYSPRDRIFIDREGDILHILNEDLEPLKVVDVRFRPRFSLTDHGFIGITLTGLAGNDRVRPIDQCPKRDLDLQSTLTLDDLICLFGKIRIVNPKAFIQDGNRDFLWLLCQSMIPAMRLKLGKPTPAPMRSVTVCPSEEQLHEQEVVHVELHISEFVARGSYLLLLPDGRLDLFVLTLTEEIHKAEKRRWKPL